MFKNGYNVEIDRGVVGRCAEFQAGVRYMLPTIPWWAGGGCGGSLTGASRLMPQSLRGQVTQQRFIEGLKQVGAAKWYV